MKLALRLAMKAKGLTSPNPLVGAVVVKDDHVVGQGYHRKAGAPHAEIIALNKAGVRARGATLYVTLEPCCHTSKRTPPCVPALRFSGITRVVVAMQDPNPKVRGKGIRALREAGMVVDVGCLERDAGVINQVYRHWITTGRPYVILKAAMTLDGKISTGTGDSKWITGSAARKHVHQLRSEVDAIAVGIGTVINDDPELSVRKDLGLTRTPRVRQPIRLIFDSRLRIPLSAKILRWAIEQPTIVCTTTQASKLKKTQLRKSSVQVLEIPQRRGKVSLSSCMKKLGKMQITQVLVEGGSELNAAMLREGLVNQVQLYVTPKLLGGHNAKGVIGGESPKAISEAIGIQDMVIKKLDQDYVFIGTCSPKTSVKASR